MQWRVFVSENDNSSANCIRTWHNYLNKLLDQLVSTLTIPELEIFYALNFGTQVCWCAVADVGAVCSPRDDDCCETLVCSLNDKAAIETFCNCEAGFAFNVLENSCKSVYFIEKSASAAFGLIRPIPSIPTDWIWISICMPLVVLAVLVASIVWIKKNQARLVTQYERYNHF